MPADVVVLVTQNEPNRGLYDELVAAGRPDVLLVGDAASPRDLQAAIAEGHRASAGALGAGSTAGRTHTLVNGGRQRRTATR